MTLMYGASTSILRDTIRAFSRSSTLPASAVRARTQDKQSAGRILKRETRFSAPLLLKMAKCHRHILELCCEYVITIGTSEVWIYGKYCSMPQRAAMRALFDGRNGDHARCHIMVCCFSAFALRNLVPGNWCWEPLDVGTSFVSSKIRTPLLPASFIRQATLLP